MSKFFGGSMFSGGMFASSLFAGDGVAPGGGLAFWSSSFWSSRHFATTMFQGADVAPPVEGGPYWSGRFWANSCFASSFFAGRSVVVPPVEPPVVVTPQLATAMRADELNSAWVKPVLVRQPNDLRGIGTSILEISGTAVGTVDRPAPQDLAPTRAPARVIEAQGVAAAAAPIAIAQAVLTVDVPDRELAFLLNLSEIEDFR